MNWKLDDLPPALREQAAMKISVRTHTIKDEHPTNTERAEKSGKLAQRLLKQSSLPSPEVAQVIASCTVLSLPKPVTEYVFHPFRKWRLDLAWPDRKIGLEIDGAVYANGRHTRGAGFEGDCEKLNQAQLLGWKVLRYSTGQVRKGAYVDDLKRVLG